MNLFLKYLDLGVDARHRSEALFAMGELADALNKKEMAQGYFEECAVLGDSLGQQARLRAAQIHYNRGAYKIAAEYYTQIKKNLSGDLAKQAWEQQIICEYRLARLNRADDLVKGYKKQYSDRNAEARFLYEEAMYYINKKDFGKAERILKNLSSKYDDVPEGARGDLGLARLYVIQTKTEDALKRLTEIPEKYDDPDIVATAYLNLADFYYENRAVENCIRAANNVLELKENGPLRAQAMDLLISSYDDLGLRDQAIALEREYIETYPHADDILDRRIKIGVFLWYLKEYDRAIIHLKELFPLVPADKEAEVQYWIAESYAGAGMTEQAIVEYLRVKYQCHQPPKLPFGVTALYKAGEGYQRIGNLHKAREMFEQVVKERGATDEFGRAANRKIQDIDEQLSRNF